LLKHTPKRHLITKDEYTYGEAFYALESMKRPVMNRNWLTQADLEAIKLNENNLTKIKNLKELDILYRAARGQGHRFLHCLQMAIGDKAAIDIKASEVEQVRSLLRVWVSIDPP